MSTRHEDAQARRDGASTKPVSWIPIGGVLGWWSLCFATYALGWPIEYEKTNFLLVAILFLVTAALTWFGFYVGRGRGGFLQLPAVSWWPWLGAFLVVVLFVPTVLTYSGFGAGDIFSAVQDQSAAYKQSTEAIESGSEARGSILLALTMAAPFTMVALPYFFLNYLRYRRVIHLVPLIACVLSPLLLSVLTGRDQQLGMLFIIMVTTALVHIYSTAGRIKARHLVGAAMVTLLLFAAMSFRKYQRVGGRELCAPGQVNCGELGNSPLVRALSTLASYAGQGFKGLGVSLDAQWMFGGGVTHSPALHNAAMTFMGSSPRGVVTDQLEVLGWSDKAYWSTALAQLANDVPWFLVPVIVGIMGFLLGYSWSSAVSTRHWLPTTLCCYAMIGTVFIPQNNQLGASGPTYLGVILLWFVVVLFRIFYDSEKR